MASSNSEYEMPLPIALVSAFVAAGRPVMPTDAAGNPRTEEVRSTLTRMMVDLDFYFAYSGRLREAIAAFDLDVPFDESVVPLPSYDDAELAAHGFANVHDPDTLAAWAIDESAFESFGQVLRDVPAGKSRPKKVGDWFRDAKRKWPTVRSGPPQRMIDAVEPSTSGPGTSSPAPAASVLKQVGKKWFWHAGIGGVPSLVAIVAVIGLVVSLDKLSSSKSAISEATQRHEHELERERAGLKVIQLLQTFRVEATRGQFTKAVENLRDAQALSDDPALSVPEHVKEWVNRAKHARKFKVRLQNAESLGETVSALRLAKSTGLAAEDPDYQYLLGLNLRRQGKLDEAAAEFEQLLRSLEKRPKKPDAPPPPEQSSGTNPLLTGFIVGGENEATDRVRLAYATTLLELKRSDKPLFKGVSDSVRILGDPPLGSKHQVWLSEIVLVNDDVLQDIVSGKLKTAKFAELREHALICLFGKHYTKSAELFAQLMKHPDFDTPPDANLVDPSIRYYAAAAAIRAGRLELGDKDRPTAEKTDEWHRQAFLWAEAEKKARLEIFARNVAGITPTKEWFEAVRYDYWLSVTRGENGRLPADERKQWDNFWKELDARFQGLRPLDVKPEDVDWDIPI